MLDIQFKSNHGYDIVIKADNVHIVEDVETRVYPKKKDGKIDISKAVERDIDTKALDQFSSILEEMIYYRKAEYDNLSLIENLIEKLPETKIEELIWFIHINYEFNKAEE